jgi:hypothetical protein
MERFSVKNLIKVEGKEQYWVEISYFFTALENLDAWVAINSACSLLERTTISAIEI